MPLKFDLSKCTGCTLCMKACASSHFQVLDAEKALLKIISVNKDGRNIHVSKSCILCRKCEKVCPEGAITSNGRWMIVDKVKCSGCGTCVRNCPTKVIFLNENKSVICDLCSGTPKCIESCPEEVISLKKKRRG